MKSQPTPAMVAASVWFSRLASNSASSGDYKAWAEWKLADEENAQAWQQIEDINRQFSQVSPEIGMATLGLPSNGRRNALKQLAVLFAVGSASWLAYRQQPWRELVADYSSNIGEQRKIALADGTHLFLNTDSAVNIRFSATERLIELVKGEVLIETGHEQLAVFRPLKLATRHGMVAAMGTRFNVRDYGPHSKVSVFEGAVKVSPLDNPDIAIILNAGQMVDFSRDTVTTVGKARATTAAWTKGMLVVYAMRLDEFTAELSRYRGGVLRCDPAIGGLVISGSFPTQDTDAVLNTLSRTLPVRIETFTRYWTTIKPA